MVGSSGYMGQCVSSNVGRLNGLASRLGDRILNVGAGDLGHGVAVLDLNRHDLNNWVVDAVLGGDLTASVLHGGNSSVSHGVSNRGNNGGNGSVGKMAVGRSQELGISFSISIALDQVSGNSRVVADFVNDVLADLHVLNLLGVDGLLGADVLDRGCASLRHQDLILQLAVGGGDVVGGGSRGTEQHLCVSVSIGGRGSLGGHSEQNDSEKLSVHDEIVLHLPR